MGKIEVTNWREVKSRRDAEHPDASRPMRVANVRRAQLDAVRAVRLADLRKEQGRTQQQVANELAVAQSRVSQIESGDLERSELGTIRAYVEALGGQLRVMADFGDEVLKVR
jgi:predicted XRE-type DNA-binding protein